MLRELWRYWTTPVSHPAVRKLGYLYESIALDARKQRCFAQWKPHYDQCRIAIEASAAQCSPGGRALVFGAGLLEDIPLAQLSHQFSEVVLVDLVFLRSARRLAKPYSNVHLVTHDVTESLVRLIRGDLRVPMPQWGLDQGFSLVVSLNLVTQLPLLPARWLVKRGVSPEQIDAYGQALMQAHVNYLRAFLGAQVCFIADRAIEERDGNGQIIDGIDPWWGLTPPPAQRLWWWEAVPLKEGRGCARCHQVGVSCWRNGSNAHAIA